VPRHLNLPEWDIQIIEKRNKLYIIVAVGPDDDIFAGATVATNEEEALSFVPDDDRKGMTQYIVFDLISIVSQARTLEIAEFIMRHGTIKDI